MAHGVGQTPRVTHASAAPEQWTTMDDLVAARERFEAAIPGWRTPVAQGLGLVRFDAPDAVEYPVVNTSQHRLPVVVLATVLGHAAGSATYDVSRDQLDEAVATLAPASAATFMEHPNLAAWRALQAELAADPTARAVAVFVADPADAVTSPYDAALRTLIGQREG